MNALLHLSGSTILVHTTIHNRRTNRYRKHFPLAIITCIPIKDYTVECLSLAAQNDDNTVEIHNFTAKHIRSSCTVLAQYWQHHQHRMGLKTETTPSTPLDLTALSPVVCAVSLSQQ